MGATARLDLPYRTVSSFPNALIGNPEVFNVTGSPIDSFGDDGDQVPE